MQPPSYRGGSQLESRLYELSLLFSVHSSICLFTNTSPTSLYTEENTKLFTLLLSCYSLTQNCLYIAIASAHRMKANCWRLSSSAGEIASVIYFPSQNGAVECILCLTKAIYSELEYSLPYSLWLQACHRCFRCYLTRRLFPWRWLTQAGQQGASHSCTKIPCTMDTF